MIKLTKKAKRAAMAAYRGKVYQEYMDLPCYGILAGKKTFVIRDNDVNEWLSSKLGINSNDNEHEIDGFIFDFSWMIQRWVVA